MKKLLPARLPPQSYIEAALEWEDHDSERVAAAREFFDRCGISPASLAMFRIQARTRVAAYTRSRRELKRIQKSFKTARPQGTRLKCRVLAREDWFDKWKLEYQVMPLGRRFTLVPEWKRKRYKPPRRRTHPVFLDPKGAFGSGGHSTTQIMVSLMERVAGRFESFLDVGTGTGLLSVIAVHLGASAVWAFDNDAGSVKAARYNMTLNGVSPEKLWAGDLKDLKGRKTFELVGANLISSVIIEHRDSIFRRVKQGGYLILSGIHLENFETVRRRLKHDSFRCLHVMKKKGWAGLLLKKKDGLRR